MKNFFVSILLFSAFFSSLLVAEQKLFAAALKNNHEVEILSLEPSKDDAAFSRGKELFMESFADAYKEFTPEQLFLENKPSYLTKFLAAAFEDEENDFNNKKEGALFVVARDVKSKEIIGFAAYDVTATSSATTVYIRQLAVDPTYKQQGVGTLLVLNTVRAIAQHQPCVVTVCTRKINEPAVNFYQNLKFQDASMEEVHPELPAYKYCGFKLNLNG